jgi:hypothetical protein
MPDKSLNTMPILGYSSQVHSLRASLSLSGDALVLSAEGAQSLYSNPSHPTLFSDPAAGHTGYLMGNATLVEAASRGAWYSLKGNWRSVDKSFISAPAQGRTQDTSFSQYGPFLHETDRYNPQTGLFFDNNGVMPNPGEDQFTSVFLPPQLCVYNTTTSTSTFFFNYLMPANAAINAGQPYGGATPNRTGYGAEGSLILLGGALVPMAVADSSNQLADSGGTTHAAETYAALGAGGVIDLKILAGLPVKLRGGWQNKTVNSSALTPTAAESFQSTQYNLGLEMGLGQKTQICLGWKHIGYDGSLAYPVTGAYLDPVSGRMVLPRLVGTAFSYAPVAGPYLYDQAYDIWAVGLSYQLTDSSEIIANFGTQTFFDTLADQKGQPSGYQLDQGFVKFNLRF